jgi:hypothetical protein
MLPSLLYDFKTYAVLVTAGYAAYVVKESLTKGAIKREGALMETLEERWKDMNAQHEDGIKSLKEEHDCAFKSLRALLKDTNARHEDDIKSLKDDIKPLKYGIKSLKEELECSNARHEDGIKWLKEEQDCAFKSLKEEQDCAFKSLRTLLEDTNARHEDAIKSLEDDIKPLKYGIKSLKEELECAMKSLEESLSIDAIKREGAQKENFEGKQIDTNLQNEDCIKSLKEEHGDAINSFEESLKEQREGANNEEDEGSKKSLEDNIIEDNLKDFYKSLDRSHRSLDQLRLNRQCYKQQCGSDIADLNQDFKQCDEMKELRRALKLIVNEDAMSRQKDTEIMKEGVDNVSILCEETWKSMEVLYQQELREMNGRSTDEESIDTVESLLYQRDL